MNKLKTLRAFKGNLENKKVLVRVDFNVPLVKGKVGDESRIKDALPTITHLLKQKAKVILISHMGRPNGKKNAELSLKPVAKKLQTHLKNKVNFIDDCRGKKVEKAIQKMKSGEILLLENCRFYAEEETNDISFAKEIAKLGDIFVHEAFSAAHRQHATTYGVAKLLPSYAGFKMAEEVTLLTKIMTKTKKPVTLIVGGAKIDTKIGLLKNFMKKADYFIVGGALANTFLAGKGFNVGDSLYEKDKITLAQEIMLLAEKNSEEFLLPIDAIIADSIGPKVSTLDIPLEDIEGKMKILDIGKQSSKKFIQIIEKSKTIIWNGPLGLTEFEPFQTGTKTIAKAISKATKNGALTVLGGGDTIDALNRFKIKFSNFSHVSTAGGAMLEFLEGKKLPGVEILKK